MADDIVKELNDWAYIVDESQGEAVVVMLTGAVFRKAADEIERLRAAGDSLAEALHGWCNGMDAFTDDAERIRAWEEGRHEQ